MTLAASRIVFQGETPYAHEREAIQFAIDSLPNSDPYHLWALLELLDPSTGRLYELDLIVLGFSALYLVEVKSGPGLYEGDYKDWYRTPPGDSRSRYMENPYRLTNHKAKVLAGRIRNAMKDRRNAPWVEPLVFLSAEDTTLKLRNHGDHGVVTRDKLLPALQHHDIPGVDASRTRRRITAPAARDIASAIKAIGLRPREGKLHAGAYALGELLEDGPGYQDRIATHRSQQTITRRARTYLVPQQTSIERRQQLHRAADRESRLLEDVREHPHILSISGYENDAALGPTVLFDAFEGGVPLSVFLRHNPELSFFDRISIIEQVGRALHYCHKKGVVHGALSPEAILVRRNEEDQVDTRLFNFQLGVGTEVEATTHWSALASEPWAIYQAPELREDPTARGAASDVFSLGAVAYHVLTGQAPGADFVAVARTLNQLGHLDPRAALDSIPDDVADTVIFATEVSPISRADDAHAWVEVLLAEVTKPEPAEPVVEQDPLSSSKGDVIGPPSDRLTIDGVLGQGATSRVFQVIRESDGRKYALKVALSSEHHERLAHEADALDSLRHSRIVQLVARLTIAGRSCLLMSVAGKETLHRHIAKEGTVSLDLAARYGEDLLSSLEYLEEHQVMHRDIKPANLGVGTANKTTAHLTLFDFSLAGADKTQIAVGTAAYRDPFLQLRGTWDNAAERWSAAITLHEMVTGVRPSFDRAALDASAELKLAAERFDPSVRSALVGFFERALAADIEKRFVSAEEMRRQWVAALEAPERMSKADSEAPGAAAESIHPPAEALSEHTLQAIEPNALIESLPLSPRAKNALDRAGLLRAEDLLQLADNRLSAIRGIGRLVAEEILTFRKKWREAKPLSAASAKPFFAGYRGDDILIFTAGLAAAAAAALSDAGLRSLAAVAAAPSTQVRALAKRHGFAHKALKEILDAENRSAGERTRPSTLEGWIESLFPARKRVMKHPRTLYGLEGAFLGQLGITAKQVADASAITTAAIYVPLGKARDYWAKHGAIGDLSGEVQSVVDAAAGALPLADAAAQLLSRMPHQPIERLSTQNPDAPNPDMLKLAQAAALFRVVIEASKANDDSDAPSIDLRYVRIAGEPWVCASDAHVAAVRALGDVADKLAKRDVLAGRGETTRALSEAVEGTPFAQTPSERLAELAALASTGAARSTRLEIYPRGMSQERALSLSASLLRSGINELEVIRRVSLRYPDAEPLPDRPALDALLAPHGLQWDSQGKTYERKGATEPTANTRVSSLGRSMTALPSQARSMEPAAVVARQFDVKLRSAVERRHFRVLGVRADRAEKAAIEIGKRFEVEPICFDLLLADAIREQMKAAGIKAEDVVHDADRIGKGGKSWPNLLKLANAAAQSVADALLDESAFKDGALKNGALKENGDKPLLLVQPGPIARYHLTAFLTRLLEASKRAEVPAILLMVPAHDTGGIPKINGELPIPGLLASQAMWVSLEWLANRHNAAA